MLRKRSWKLPGSHNILKKKFISLGQGSIAAYEMGNKSKCIGSSFDSSSLIDLTRIRHTMIVIYSTCPSASINSYDSDYPLFSVPFVECQGLETTSERGS